MPKYQNENPLAKLHPEEPYFFIRSTDIHAPAAVTAYSSMLNAAGDRAGSAECMQIAEDIRAWQKKNPSLVKHPD